MGRHGTALTWTGRVNLKAARNRFDRSPVDENCSCAVCSTYSRAYIHHLLSRDEMLGKILLSYHNISFLMNFVRELREAIAEERYMDFKTECLRNGLIGSNSLESFSSERMG
jgi:queuine tRNA-ribosyltransferase